MAKRSRCFSRHRFRRAWQHDPTTQSSNPRLSAAQAIPLVDGFEKTALGSRRRPRRAVRYGGQPELAVQSRICKSNLLGLWSADGGPNAGTMQVHQQSDAEPKFQKAQAGCSFSSLSRALFFLNLQSFEAWPNERLTAKAFRRLRSCSSCGLCERGMAFLSQFAGAGQPVWLPLASS